MKIFDVFTPPFQRSGSYILDDKHRICMNSLVSNKAIDQVLDKLNDVVDKKFENVSSLSEDKQKILYNGTPIFLIRAWGRLTGTGGLNLSEDEAIKLQDAFAEWIVEKLNT